MWRLLLRILLFSLVLYVDGGVRLEKIGACPDDSVCVLFANIWEGRWCLIDGVQSYDKYGGYLWEGANSCDRDYFHSETYSFLQITPVALRNWTFTLVLWANTYNDPSKGGDDQQITNVGFNFPRANFTFKSAEIVEFSWKDKNGQLDTKKITMEKVGARFISDYCYDSNWPGQSEVCYFDKYRFNVDSIAEKLIDYFGVEEFNFTKYQYSHDPTKRNMHFQSRKYVEMLSDLTECDPKEINEPCYQSCDGIELANTTTANCSSNLWYHDAHYSVYTRQWRLIDEIVCKMGSWQAVWGGEKPGTQVLNPERFEVQCSGGIPSRITAKMSAIMLGAGIGGGILLIIILVVVGFILFKKFKGNDNGGTNRGTTRSESNAEGKSSKNTQSNRIPGVSPTASSTPSKTTSPFTPDSHRKTPRL